MILTDAIADVEWSGRCANRTRPAFVAWRFTPRLPPRIWREKHTSNAGELAWICSMYAEKAYI